MKRRGWTVLIGLTLTAMLTWALLGVTVPYVVLGPGPTIDTLGSDNGKAVITITGHPSRATTGQLRLVTVGVQSRLTLADALYYWADSTAAVVPRELVYPPDKTDKQVDAENAAQFTQSQTSAETAALRELGYPIHVTVKDVVSAPAQGLLAPGDIITALDGKPITVAQQLTDGIKAKPAGARHELTFQRAGSSHTVAFTASAASDGSPRLGVTIDEVQPHPFTINIDVTDIGGPSAGLMFALGIIDKLGATDLTGGRTIAGTGEISEDGTVSIIGGIAQKLVAAKQAGATAFLTPSGNCAEATANAQPGLQLISVHTLDDALTALADLRGNHTPPLCPTT